MDELKKLQDRLLQLEEENQLEIMLPILNRNGQEKWIMCKGCRVEKEENE